MNDPMEISLSSKRHWYIVNNVQEIPSPSLLVYPDRVEVNIMRMMAISGDVNMLRPHVKTHKMPEIIRLQLKHGINKFKCATIAEAEMVANTGAKDILLAMQPVGPNIERFFRLKQRFTATKFSCIVDSEEVVLRLSEAARTAGLQANLYIDINNGMNRTGIFPDKDAARLFKIITDQPGLNAEGLHVYDGQIHEPNFFEREKVCNEAFMPVSELVDELRKTNNRPLSIVAGGTPTFPIHAARKGVETSPGTLLLWDYGYSSSFADLNFLHSAVLLTRIVSKPGKDLICLDLGHKAIGSEMPHPRVKFPDLDNYDIIGHNEEHMVIRTELAGNMKTGDVLYGIPYHICPTVDRYDVVTVVRDGMASDEWKVEARRRKITI